MSRLTIFIAALLLGIVSAGAAQPKRYVGPVEIPDSTIALSEFSSPAELHRYINDEKVIVGKDTISMILPERNFGRYDRGLFNFLFIPKGQWAFGLTAGYGEFNTDDVQVLSILKGLTFKGKQYSVSPTVSYFFRSNQSIGLKFNYSRGTADLEGMSVNFDDDLNFTLSDVSYYRRSTATISV